MYVCMYVYIYIYTHILIEGSLEVKLPTTWTDEKAEVGRVREEKSRREKIREEKESEERRSGTRKGSKVAKHCVFPVICGPRGSKSRLAKAAGAEPCGQMRDDKLHAVVARSTFPSQNVQRTPAPDHFWKLRCRKSARSCGAKHISKSKTYKTRQPRTFLEVEMSKKCTPLWCEAHFHVKRAKTWRARSTFGRVDVVLRGRRKEFCTLPKVSKTGTSFNYNYRYTTLHYTTRHDTTQHDTTRRDATLRYTTLRCTQLHCTTQQLQLQL